MITGLRDGCHYEDMDSVSGVLVCDSVTLTLTDCPQDRGSLKEETFLDVVCYARLLWRAKPAGNVPGGCSHRC